jgi:hypothetical protein
MNNSRQVQEVPLKVDSLASKVSMINLGKGVLVNREEVQIHLEIYSKSLRNSLAEEDLEQKQVLEEGDNNKRRAKILL